MPRQPSAGEFEGGFEQAYISWDTQDEFKDVLKATASNVESYDGLKRSMGSLVSDFGRTFISTDSNISVRSEYNRVDYEHYRSGERIPTKDVDIIRMCMQAYERVSIVRSIIDMMGDFTVQGIRLVHPNKKIENFHKNWFKTVQGPFVSERIANMLYRTANCPVKVRMGRIPVAIEEDWRKNYADDDIKINQFKPQSRVIPLGYTILNPLTIEVIGGELSSFVGKPIYALKISQKFKMMMRQNEILAMKNASVKEMMQCIPDNIRSAIIAGMTVVPLDQSKIEMLYYKKDDWKVWSTPMLYSILEPLIMLEKMHLADISALDGAISQIRLWRLGDIEHKILPTRAAINKLRNILANVGAGVLELVWGPELDFKESSSQVHHYLDSKKYQQVMTEIYAGLGIPDSLTAGGGKTQGFTNNAIAMKTLVERLEYGRRLITAFWDKELKKVQKAMGWRFPAKVVFDFRVLSDEIAERALLIDMWDREILATETIHELSRRDPEIETIRINREAKSRKAGNTPEKAGPYHNAQWDIELKKILLTGGVITPSEADVRLEPKKEGEKPMVVQTQEFESGMVDKQNQNSLEIADRSSKQQMQATKQTQEHQMRLAKMNNAAKIKQAKLRPKGTSGQGRPKNSKDSKTRKTRTAKPRKASAEVLSRRMWAVEAQKQIADIVSPFLLERFGKKNLRSFTKAEVEQAEFFKFGILNHIEPYSEITQEKVYNILQLEQGFKCDEEIIGHCKTLAAVFSKHHGREPSLEETREIQATAYALRFQDVEN